MNKPLLIALAALTTFISMPATYARPFWGGHARRAQVLHGDQSLARGLRFDRGHLGGNYGNLMAQDRSIRRQEQADARANGGYLTRGQQRQLDGEERGLMNNMNRDYRNAATPGTFGYNHPRRAQVLGEDRSLNHELAQDKGNLGGNYGHLEREDQSIRRQEQRDARLNGGYITDRQENHLMNEEDRLQNQINHDVR